MSTENAQLSESKLNRNSLTEEGNSNYSYRIDNSVPGITVPASNSSFFAESMVNLLAYQLFTYLYAFCVSSRMFFYSFLN